MFDEAALGAHLRALRTEQGLGLRQLADAAGVSVSMLSAIERAEKTPTVAVLARIADGLGLAPSRLLAALESDRPRALLRRAARQEAVHEPGGWRRVVLTPVVPGVNFEWIRTTLPPGCDAGMFPAYAPGSHEFVAVDSGRLHMTVGAEHYVLEAGDSLYFPADAEHGYANPGAAPCVYHVAALIMRPRTAGRPGALA